MTKVKTLLLNWAIFGKLVGVHCYRESPDSAAMRVAEFELRHSTIYQGSTTLQANYNKIFSSLLVQDLQVLSGSQWEACFHKVLFPLLNRLLGMFFEFYNSKGNNTEL